ncbi:sensor histidine kinase [Luteimonas viscosa]|uniref:Sensor histidine kinase n=1 Tax=Luteimonas viscosa TaxID=1132694 RepID=A0A5D4XNW9_9GAMM|nr:sensor histidine kinase [Luteimonas viscosa]
MLSRLDHARLLRYAGLFTWAVMVMPLWVISGPVEDGDPISSVGAGWHAWIAWAMFGFSFAWLTRALDARRVSIPDYVLLALMIGSAVALSYYSNTGLGVLLLMVAACVLPWLLPLPASIAALVVSVLLVVPVYMRAIGFSLLEAVMQSLLYAGFNCFVFATGYVARQQVLARDEQRRLNAELRATRALLAESVRVNERTRISRELHDLLGHHLTALSLNLEVANHLVSGQAQEHVSQAHTLAKLLLSDVREAVSRLRDDDAIDMRATLLPLADNVPGLRIDMDMPQAFLLDDPERAHVLLRCTQEIITNAVRHAEASLLRLRYCYEGDAVLLEARDDGRGAECATAGNGLLGMRERLAAHGGTLQVETSPGNGFTVRLRLPLGDGVVVQEAAPSVASPLSPQAAPASAVVPRRHPLEVP